jgi:hypothetical protein
MPVVKERSKALRIGPSLLRLRNMVADGPLNQPEGHVNVGCEVNRLDNRAHAIQATELPLNVCLRRIEFTPVRVDEEEEVCSPRKVGQFVVIRHRAGHAGQALATTSTEADE